MGDSGATPEAAPRIKIYLVMLQIVNYSEKAVALVGDTKAVKKQLKEIGGRFNMKLTCGPGWIFSAKKRPEIEKLISELDGMPTGARTAEAPKKANELPEWYVTPEQAKAEGIIYLEGDFFCRLSDGGLVEFVKPKIETRFCFGYGTYRTFEEAADAERKAGEDYFLRENLRGFDDGIETLEGDGVLFVYNATNMEKNRNWSDVPMHYGNPVMMNDTDRARLLEACKMQRAKFEKRLQEYLKRYGLSKIKKWTYWDNE